MTSRMGNLIRIRPRLPLANQLIKGPRHGDRTGSGTGTGNDQMETGSQYGFRLALIYLIQLVLKASGSGSC